jgi:capsular polysaccharide biosynthesis protein
MPLLRQLIAPVRTRLGYIRRSRQVRAVVNAVNALRRRIRQRITGRWVVGFWRTTHAYADGQRSSPHPASYQAIDPPISMRIPAAVLIGATRCAEMRERTFHAPETFIARIPGALVVGHKGAVLAPDRRVIWDLSYDYPGLPDRHEIYDWNPNQGAIEDLPGITATLATMGSEVNYYHFLLNAFPRIDALRRTGALAEADRILVSGALTPWLSDALSLAKVPVGKLIGTAQHPVVRCQTLIAPALILDPFTIPKRAMDWVRGEILPHVPWDGRRRRILIDRSDANCRRVVNIEEHRPFLESRGIEVFRLSGMSLLDQAGLFQQADLVIANHGAALTNIIFCRPGARIIQLIPDGMIEHNFRPLATYGGLSMDYLVCPVAPGCEHIHTKDKNLLFDEATLGRISGWCT